MLTACQLFSFVLPFSEQVSYDWRSAFLRQVLRYVPLDVSASPVLEYLEFLLQDLNIFNLIQITD